MLLSTIGVLFISSVALCAPSDSVEVGVCSGDGCSALKSSVGAIEVILFSLLSIVTLRILAGMDLQVSANFVCKFHILQMARRELGCCTHADCLPSKL